MTREFYATDGTGDYHYVNLFYPDGEFITKVNVESVDILLSVLNKLYDEKEALKKELFESRMDYIIETADISDTLHIKEDIKEEAEELGLNGKLCETLGEYLCSYCSYAGPLGHCQYYNKSYTLNDAKRKLAEYKCPYMESPLGIPLCRKKEYNIDNVYCFPSDCEWYNKKRSECDLNDD